MQSEAAEAAGHDGGQNLFRIKDRQEQAGQIAEYRVQQDDQPDQEELVCVVHLAGEKEVGEGVRS